MVKRAKTDKDDKPQWTKIIFYIEGGKTKTDGLFRKAFRDFFKSIVEAAELKGIEFQAIPIGSREEAYRVFCREVKVKPDVLSILIVDSETEVAVPNKPWKHLLESQQDQWKKPPSVKDEQCHLMAQAMEAWFFADPDKIADCYGKKGFNAGALPQTLNVENIPKVDHVRKLEEAIKGTPTKEYSKSSHGPKILGMLDVAKVRKRAEHCERIFVEVGNMIGVDLKRQDV